MNCVKQNITWIDTINLEMTCLAKFNLNMTLSIGVILGLCRSSWLSLCHSRVTVSIGIDEPVNSCHLRVMQVEPEPDLFTNLFSSRVIYVFRVKNT